MYTYILRSFSFSLFKPPPLQLRRHSRALFHRVQTLIAQTLDPQRVQSGLWAGIFMLCLAAVLNYTSTTMLITAGEKIGRLNYEELMAASFGDAGTHAFTLFAGVLAFGAMSAYLVIVGDTVPEVLLASGITTGPLADRETVIGIVAIFCVLPLSLLRDLSKLAYTSGISVFADVLLTIIVLAAASGEAR